MSGLRPSFGAAKPALKGLVIKKAESALTGVSAPVSVATAAPSTVAAPARNQTLGPVIKKKVAFTAPFPPPALPPAATVGPRAEGPRAEGIELVVEDKPVVDKAEDAEAAILEEAVGGAGTAAVTLEPAGVKKPVEGVKVKAAGPIGPLLDRKDFLRNEFTSVKQIVKANPIEVIPTNKLYRPITAPSFRRFIVDTFIKYSPILTRVKAEKSDAFTREPKVFNRNACKERPEKLETFYYQKLVRDYLARISPYRGLLVYHGLGTGKTCTSIAATEALHWGGMKIIYIMTPATLSPNFKRELGKCGFFPLNTQNNWAFLAVTKVGNTSPEFVWLRDVLGLSEETIQRQGGGWVPNPAKANNWDALDADSQKAVLQQQDEHMKHRFRFIHYNGITTKILSDLAIDALRRGQPIFDDSVVVIDEVHNLVRTVNGTKLGSRPVSNILAEIEPREATWTQRLGRERIGFRYPRGYALYRLLQNAVGCKILALSATPMINYAQELAILMNMIGGELRILELSLKAMDRSPATSTRLMEWAQAHREIDYCAIKETESKEIVLIVTPVPYGFQKVVGANYTTRGFVRLEGAEAIPVSESRERNMDQWALSLLKQLEEGAFFPAGYSAKSVAAVEAGRAALNASIAASALPPLPPSVPLAATDVKARTKLGAKKETPIMLNETEQFRIRTVPLLPESPTVFVENFIDRTSLKIKHANILKARISGLVSYYKGGSEELMPRIGINKMVEVEMSEHMFKTYVEIRQAEIDKASPAKKEEEGAAKPKAAGRALTQREADLYTQATKDAQTGFMAGSRAACNYTFPLEVPRPKLSVKQQQQVLGIDKAKTIAVDRGDYIEAPATGGAGSAAAAAVEADEEGGEEGGNEGENEGGNEEGNEVVEQALPIELAKIVGTLMSGLEANASQYLDVGLPEYSPKYVSMMANMRLSPGPTLVYSNFKSLEGLGIFAAALRASPEKWLPLDIQKVGDGQWGIPPALLGPDTKGRPRYILYTGDQELDKRRLLLQLYNADLKNLPPLLKTQCQQLLDGAEDNRDGRVCRAFMITQSGAEGISLMNTRQVHIMEPYWNNVRIQQVIGRAIRLCSHMNLEWDNRVVDIYTYLSVFSEDQKATKARAIMMADKAMTTDQQIMDIAVKKQTLADGLFEITQGAAIDCELHYYEHGGVTQCLKYPEAGGPTFAYHPDWQEDIANSAPE